MSQTINHTLPNAGRTYAVLDAVAAERARQHAHMMERHGASVLDLTDPGTNIFTKYGVLLAGVEGMLQTAENLADCSGPAAPLCREELRAELIQVAAVAVAIAESLQPQN